MPDYLLTGPEGQRFNLTVPEGVAPESIPETLSASGAFEAFAQRTKQAVQPEGRRKEGPITDWIVGQGEKLVEGAKDIVRHPESLVGTHELGAPAMGVVRSFTSPRQIRSHLDELTAQLREGRITQEQYGQARERMGLPREVPGYLQPRSVSPGPRPEIGSRPVNRQTLTDLGAQQNQPLPQRVSQLPTTSRRPATQRDMFSGPGYDDAEARSLFDTHLAPHFGDPQAFTQSFFNGGFNSGFQVRSKAFDEKRTSYGISFDGELTSANGTRLGAIHREIYPDRREARHEYLRIEDGAQGSGFVKQMTANQFEAYRKMGIERVDLLANIDSGGYAWAKYGWLPSEKDWQNTHSWEIGSRLNELVRRGLIDPEAEVVARAHLNSGDPHAIWSIADIPTVFDPTGWTYKSTHGRSYAADPRINTVGKALLVGSSWHGDFRLSDPDQMGRFNAYIGAR